MLLYYQRVHSITRCLHLFILFFLGIYIPRGPTLYTAHCTVVPPTACTGQGAVIDLSRTSLPPREPVALENRFTAAEERERSNERHRGR